LASSDGGFGGGGRRGGGGLYHGEERWRGVGLEGVRGKQDHSPQGDGGTQRNAANLILRIGRAGREVWFWGEGRESPPRVAEVAWWGVCVWNWGSGRDGSGMLGARWEVEGKRQVRRWLGGDRVWCLPRVSRQVGAQAGRDRVSFREDREKGCWCHKLVLRRWRNGRGLVGACLRRSAGALAFGWRCPHNDRNPEGGSGFRVLTAGISAVF
jgi:hypothetical protein